MDRKFIISVIAMFILAYAFGFFVHGVLLHGDYAKLPNLMRPMPEFMSKLPFMIAAHLFMAAGFTWIYLKGRENKPWLAQGVRYGIAVAVLMTIPTYLIYHAVSPFPLDLAIKQIVFDTATLVIMGIALAWINR